VAAGHPPDLRRLPDRPEQDQEASVNNGSAVQVGVAPLTTPQRQRLECMTAVRALWYESRYSSTPNGPPAFDMQEVLTMTHYLMTGEKP
jgi:hypothetical protein